MSESIDKFSWKGSSIEDGWENRSAVEPRRRKSLSVPAWYGKGALCNASDAKEEINRGFEGIHSGRMGWIN